MWLAMNDAFLSIVRKGGTPPHMLTVRARIKGDIERVFPGVKVEESWKTDYRFRALVKDSDVAAVMARRIMQIDYDNFKSSVKDHARHNYYMSIWGIMFRAQEDGLKRGRAVGRRTTQAILPWDDDDFRRL